MTGRDIVKFILANNLLDKSCISTSGDRVVIRFLDYLVNDDEIIYALTEEGKERIALRDVSDNYLIKSNNVHDYKMAGLKQLDNNVVEDKTISKYNVYLDTFKSWLNTVEPGSIIYDVVKYSEIDSNFSRNCTTYNKMMSYLEGKEVSYDIIRSADLAWTQYMRECRECNHAS